jgi:hypothetical protein
MNLMLGLILVAEAASLGQSGSPFLQAVVLHESFDDGGQPPAPGKPGQSKRFQPGQGYATADNIQAYNTTDESWGLSCWFNFQTAPSISAPVNMTSGAGGQWTLAAMSPTWLKIIVTQPGGASVDVDVVGVDDLVGRWTHVVVGYDLQSRTLSIWIDRILRGSATVPNGVGFSPTYTAPFRLNFNDAGYNPADFSADELIYAVGAAPTQDDVDMLFGQEEHKPGFFASVNDAGDVEVTAYGAEFTHPDLSPKAWLDGKFLTLKRTRNNPPTEIRFTSELGGMDLASGPHPLRVEWRWNKELPPDHVTEVVVQLDREPIQKPATTPPENVGVAHIRRDGSVGFELKEDSEIYVGVYGFGAGEFADDRYGIKVRDEMLAANMGVEGGSILHYQKQPGGWRQWLEMTEQMRIANGTALKRWPGPWSVPDDDFLGPDALAALMQEPGWEGYINGWCDWRNNVTKQRPRFVVYKDEVNLAFGGDPEDSTQPLLAKIAPYGGMGSVVDALKAGSRVPCGPGLFGVDSAVPAGYTKWTLPRYADFVMQYHQPNIPPAPWTGQTLRQAAETLEWAARHRDPARPFSLNVSLIIGYQVKQPDGSWKTMIPSTAPRSIPAQYWVDLAYGATVIRGYALHAFDLGKRDDAPAGTEYQQAVKPGDPEYYAMLNSAAMIRDYAKYLLGAEQSIPYAGPDFLCGHRLSPKGRVWFAVNLSEVERSVQEVPNGSWRSAEILDDQGNRRSVPASTRTVPGNGVLVLIDGEKGPRTDGDKEPPPDGDVAPRPIADPLLP